MNAARLAVLLALAGCWGEPAPAPAPEPALAPLPAAKRDTGEPAPTETPEELARREFFEKMKAGEVPVPVAPAPAPVAPAPAPVVAKPAPAPAPVAPKPAPAPTRPAPRPVVVAPAEPVPLPKPTTTIEPVPAPRPEPVAVAPVTRPAPAPAPTPEPAPMTRPAPAPAPEPAPTTRPAPAPEPAVAVFEPEEDTGPAVAEGPDPLERCGAPDDLVTGATKGALSNADLACLEEAYALARTRYDRERISVVALTNAYASGDRIAQEDYLVRHLVEVDPANPEMAYRYALLLRQEGGSPREIVRWAEVGLTYRAAWTGETYLQRVFSLYKLRAAASQDLLDQAEAAQAEFQTEEADRALAVARETTKRHAREWYAFARDEGLDTKAAYELCLIASQSAAYCDGS